MEDGRVLESWKAIATHLGRTEKTCRKWEHELGLPVHRLDRSGKAHVFAYADELDRWREQKLRTEKTRKPKSFSRLFGLSRVSHQARFWIIAVFGLVVLAIAGILIRQITKKSPSPRGTQAVRGIAILPFADLSPSKEYEYLCDGMAETLIDALGKIEGLRVPARTSAFYFKGKNTPLQEIGKKLNVNYVLEASVQVEGEKLRMIPRLLSVADGYLIWSEKYDRSREDIWATQDDIAREIVRAMKIEILGNKNQPLVKAYTENRKAYELYLKGRYFWEKRGKANLERSIEYYRQALDEDPVFALAHAGIALSYYVLGSNFHLPPGEAHRRAKAALRRAFEIDGILAEAYIVRAGLRMDCDYEFASAEEDFKTAIQIDPGNATAHHWYACPLTYLGRHEEAIAEIKLARDIDPLAPMIAANVVMVLYYARRYDEALSELKKAIELYSSYPASFLFAGDVYAALGMYDIAVSFHQKCIDLSGPDSGLSVVSQLSIAYVYGLSGKKEEARKALEKIIAQSRDIYVNPTIVASVWCGLGEKDQAFTWLERGFNERAHLMVTLKVDPRFDLLRSDPRFTDLLRRIGLEK